MRIIEDIKPTVTASRTDASVNDQHITYNEVGVTYNDPLYQYGGQYGQQDVFPSIRAIIYQNLPVTSMRTAGTILDQHITYNQTGITYNEAGYFYGGYNVAEQILPLISLASNIYPRIALSGDIQITTPPPVNNNMSIGPGWFMYVTQ